jgi:predicted amidophosphoribosyltransferase
MMLQLDALKWPLPDIIIPTPGDWFDSNEGWKTRKIMAKELAIILQVPYSSCIKLKRHLCSVPYASLESQPFFAEDSCLLCSEEVVNKKVLLIHDEYKTGVATFLSAKKAFSCGALSIYSLSFTAHSHSPFAL